MASLCFEHVRSVVRFVLGRVLTGGLTAASSNEPTGGAVVQGQFYTTLSASLHVALRAACVFAAPVQLQCHDAVQVTSPRFAKTNESVLPMQLRFRAFTFVLDGYRAAETGC